MTPTELLARMREAANKESPSPEAEARALDAMSAAHVAGGTAGSTSALFRPEVLVGLAAAGAVAMTGVWLALRPSNSPPAVPPREDVRVAPTPAAVEPPPLPLPPAPVPGRTAPPPPRRHSVPPPPAATPPSPEPAPPPVQLGLAEEIVRVDALRAMLRRGDLDGARGALDRHALDFPSGALKPEVALIRIEVVLRRDGAEAARAYARSWLASDEGRAYQNRVKTLFERAGAVFQPE